MLKNDEIIDFFKLENSHAKKELGQNFLVNENIASNIVNSLKVEKDDNVLEIGPGLGALTEKLIDKDYHLTVVEYDQKFVNYLTLAYGDKKINIIKNNVVKIKEVGFHRVIGNLPYYMTTEIIEFITTKFKELKSCVFMVQKECFLRLTALKGKDVNALNIFLNYLYDVKKLFDVNKTNFFPMPSVDSLVFSLERKKDVSLDFALNILKVARVLFLNRRKTIYNNLNTIIKDKEKTHEILAKLNLKENLRAEELKIDDYINLTNILKINSYIK